MRRKGLAMTYRARIEKAMAEMFEGRELLEDVKRAR